MTMNENDWKKFWEEIWVSSNTPFHQEEVEPLLVKHLPLLKGSRVVVPLCGKSRDMVWLKSQGYEVIAIELSPLACEQFFREVACVDFEIVQEGTFQVFRGGSYQIYCGDFFQISPLQLGRFSLIYDRAALIALSPSFQKKYVDHLLDLMEKTLSQNAVLFLITFDFFEKPNRPPPYLVSEQDVRRLFGSQCDIQIVSPVEEKSAISEEQSPRAAYQKKLYLLQLS